MTIPAADAIPARHHQQFDGSFLAMTHVSPRAVEMAPATITAPVSIERFVSEQLAEGDGTPEYRAWLERQAEKRGLG